MVILTNNKAVGFGNTNIEAKKDLLLNTQKITQELTLEQINRREELSAWLPDNNILHIDGVCCIEYNANTKEFVNKLNGKTVTANKYDNVYSYLAKLVGNKLTYEDISVVIQKELDEYFSTNLYNHTYIANMPVIKLSSTYSEFNPYAVYVMDNGMMIGIADTTVGIKFTKNVYYHVVECDNIEDGRSLLSYIGYKLGCILVDGVVVYGETD